MKFDSRKISNEIADDLSESMCFPENDVVMRQTTARPIQKAPSWNTMDSEIKVDYSDICEFKL